uniref:Focadhesin n=1 Tax=Salmo trutta TaxID=8032 RepID=A0A673VPL5_SALTR
MSENLKKRFDFPSPLIQAQTVRSLVAAVLKEKGQNERISQSSTQGPAMEALWEQCCSDCAAVRSACCDAVVLLVEQAHADLHYILNSVLNLLPSARNVQGLIKVIGRLLQVQADQRDKGTPFTCPYSIRSSPHPYIIVLENRPDCWPVLLLEIDDFIQRSAYVTMLAPFLRYLYCEPQRLPEYALLRHSLFRVLLPPQPGYHNQEKKKDQENEEDPGQSPVVCHSLVRCLYELFCQPPSNPHLPLIPTVFSTPYQKVSQLALPLSPWSSEVLVATQVLRQVTGDPVAASEWLLAVTSALPLSQRVPSPLTLTVAHLVVTGQQDVCRLALKTAAAIALADPAQVATGNLYWLKRNIILYIDVCLCVWLPLSDMCGCQLCLPQVLHTLQMLGSAPKLRAVALRLMTALWEKQDRVYPDLQRLISQFEKSSVLLGKEAQWEQILARAACVRDICRERPYQHGGDMLAAITHTLAQCSRPDQAAPAALALQGLHELCRTEVVDVGSTWTALGPKLSCDSRPLVVKAIGELLALLPQLTVKTEEYEVHQLLLQIFCVFQEPEVASCGYKALSEFSESAHTLLHLPEQVRVPLNKRRSPNLFLTSLVKQEMSQMPRGVYHSALKRGSLRSDQGKTVAGIPGFMLKTYEKSKQPGLKPGLAAGLLLSFDLPIQTDRDGRPINRFLLSRGRSYQLMLATLIHEVNIQPSEWHRALLLPQAWRGFMSRAYHSVLQGRRAELEMQQKQGKESPEELQYKQHCAWLWVRDQLTDVVKSAAKDSPVVQGNSILALSGLAAVLAKYESNMPADTEGGLGVGPEILSTSTWLAMILDTLLSIVSSSYKPRGQVFPWFLHRSYSGENTASAIARSCAALALSLVVPVLVAWHKDSVPQVLATLRAGLPGSPTADDSQAVQFHSGLALGMLLSCLHQERLSDVSGQKITELLMSSLDTLEACCFDSNLEYNAGCVLGLGLVLGALSGSGQTEHRARVGLTLDKLLEALQGDSSSQGRMLQEVLAYSVAGVGVAAFSGGVVDALKAEEIMSALRSMTEESQQTPGFSLALGLVVHGLSSCGHGKAEDIQPRLLDAWIKILLAEGCPTMQRLAAVNGLVALVGSETGILQVSLPTFGMGLIITFSGAIGLQSNSACLVGHLHLAHMSTSHSRTAVPQDFSYLPEKSVIRSVVDFLAEAGKKGPEFAHPSLVKTGLGSLATVGGSYQYPPVNWSAILSPLMRLNFGEVVQHQCIELASNQAQSSQSASLFLGVWLSPPLVHSLSMRTRGHLYDNLSVWMKHVSEDKLQVYVETLGLQQFQQDVRPQRLAICLSLLRGLAQAMALPNPPNTVWAVLCTTIEKIFNLFFLVNHTTRNWLCDQEVHLYVGVSKCLSELADTEIDRIMEKTGFILAHLTSQGRVPLLGLNDVIAAVLRGWSSHKVGWLLLQTFYQCRLAASPNTGVSKRMEWLLELMGLIRNVAYGVTTATDFLLQVFAAAVISWGDHTMPLLLGVRTQWFPWQQGSEPPGLPHALYGDSVLAEQSVSLCLLGLPHSLRQLLAKEPWREQSQKVVLVSHTPLVFLSPFCTAALLALKSSTDFKKKAVWTRAYGW